MAGGQRLIVRVESDCFSCMIGAFYYYIWCLGFLGSSFYCFCGSALLVDISLVYFMDSSNYEYYSV